MHSAKGSSGGSLRWCFIRRKILRRTNHPANVGTYATSLVAQHIKCVDSCQYKRWRYLLQRSELSHGTLTLSTTGRSSPSSPPLRGGVTAPRTVENSWKKAEMLCEIISIQQMKMMFSVSLMQVIPATTFRADKGVVDSYQGDHFSSNLCVFSLRNH